MLGIPTTRGIGPGQKPRSQPGEGASGPRTRPSRHGDGAHHPAVEEYCEAIYELGEDHVEIIQARIADRLRLSRPAVSEMLHRMAGQGLVVLDKTIELTPAGRAIAEGVVRRHRLAERFLTDVLELSWADAHHEADKWEHIISPAVEQAMIRMLADPSTCPHGNPIPGTIDTRGVLVALHLQPVGAEVTISRITEELEAVDGVLTFLEQNGVVPGRTATIVARTRLGELTLRLGSHEVELPAFVASRISVTPPRPHPHPSTLPEHDPRDAR